MHDTLSTTFTSGQPAIAQMQPAASPFTPHSRVPIVAGRESNGRRMTKTEKEERLARDRAEIAARVARFRETQKRFEREREEYCDTTLANAVSGSGRPSFWR